MILEVGEAHDARKECNELHDPFGCRYTADESVVSECPSNVLNPNDVLVILLSLLWSVPAPHPAPSLN